MIKLLQLKKKFIDYITRVVKWLQAYVISVTIQLDLKTQEYISKITKERTNYYTNYKKEIDESYKRERRAIKRSTARLKAAASKDRDITHELAADKLANYDNKLSALADLYNALLDNFLYNK